MYQHKKSSAAELLDMPAPHDADSERMLLRSLILAPDNFDKFDLTATDFYVPSNRRIFLAMANVREDSKPLDVAHLFAELQSQGWDHEVGGASGLAEIVVGEALPARTDDYLAAVKECTRKRQLKMAGEMLLRDALSGRPSAEIAAGLREQVERLQAEASGEVIIGSRPVVVPMTSVVAQRIEWFWPARIPMGKLSLIVGDPGCSKSLLTVDLSARASRGALWPTSSDRAPQGRVLLICCEDDPADTIRPRLEAAGADMAQVDLLPAVEYPDPDTGERRERLLNLQTDAHLLDQIFSGGNYVLAVLDTLTGFIGKADNNSSTEVRNALTPLAVLAAKHNVAIVGIQHLTKNSATAARYRTNGSVAYNGLARSVLAVGRDHKEKDLRLVAGVKTNLGPPPATLGYRVRVSNGVPHLEWLAKPIDIDADEMLGEPAKTKSDAAADWLLKFLEDGPQPANVVKTAAVDAGFSERTIDRAKQTAGIEQTKQGMKGGWLWHRPEHASLTDSWHSSQSSGKSGGNVGILRGEIGIFEVT